MATEPFREDRTRQVTGAVGLHDEQARQETKTTGPSLEDQARQGTMTGSLRENQALEWKNSSIMSSPRNISCIDSDVVDSFFDIVCNSPRDQPLADLLNLSPNDLLTLACDYWLSNFIVMAFAELVNGSSDDTRVFFLHSTNLFCLNLKKTKRELNGKTDPRIIFCMLVQNVNGHITTTFKGNHFTCAVYFPYRNIIVYCDTYGWSIPQDFYTKFSECEKSVEVYFAHHPELTTFDPIHTKYCHQCEEGICSKFFMKQSCSNACGVAVVIAFTLAAFCCDMFDVLVEVQPVITPQSERVAYLKDISSNSAFLRHVLIVWVMKRQINVSMLFDAYKSSPQVIDWPEGDELEYDFTQTIVISEFSVESEVGISKHALDDTDVKSGINNEYGLTPTKVKLENRIDDISESSNITNDSKCYLPQACGQIPRKVKQKPLFSIPEDVMTHLKKRPKVNFNKRWASIQVVIYLENHDKPLYKCFKCSENGKKDNIAIAAIQSFFDHHFFNWLKEKSISIENEPNVKSRTKFDCNEELLSLILQPPSVHFYSPGPSLRVLLTSVNSKKTFYRYFKCTDKGINDASAMEKVRQFLSSKEAVIWLQKREESRLEWIADGELQVGIDTKDFFDQFEFDITKDVNISKGIKLLYNSHSTLAASVVENVRLGHRHRFDESYILDPTFENCESLLDKPVVTMYVKCASKSTQCRTSCGHLISSLSWNDVKTCPVCSLDLSDKFSQCDHCLIDSSPFEWYHVEGKTLCSACYQYRQKHKTSRPAGRKVNPSYHPHVRCGWRMKFVIYGSDLSIWHVYKSSKNGFYHTSPAKQGTKRPSLSVCDEWDEQKVTNNTSPHGILISLNRKSALYVDQPDGEKNNFDVTDQINNCLETFDKRHLSNGMKKADEHPLNSDWRNTEKVLEKCYDDVLFFQRGDDSLNRNYCIVIATEKSLEFLRKYGKNVVGHDVKHDIMPSKFKASLITFTDVSNTSRAAVFSICNRETEAAHALTLEIVRANVPCDKLDCPHDVDFCKFNDGNGFVRIRNCSLLNPISPIFQHDKDQAIRNAVHSYDLNSILCNFHSLQALRQYITSDESLSLFLRPIETGFKCIMRSWNSEIREKCIKCFNNFVKNTLPGKLCPVDVKLNFLQYLCENWFTFPWNREFTSEMLYSLPEQDRHNPLILIDSPPQSKSCVFNDCYLQKKTSFSLSQFVLKILEIIHVDVKELEDLNRKYPDVERIDRILLFSKETNLAAKGIEIVQKNHVVFSSVIDSSWKLIRSDSCNGTWTHDETLPDSFLEEFSSVKSNDDMPEDMEELYDSIVPLTKSSVPVADLVTQITSEHCCDVIFKSKCIVTELNRQAASIFHDAIFDLVPFDLKQKFEDGMYICNSKLSICTCVSFIMKGQPYFCKHLYACISFEYGIQDEKKLIDMYCTHVPISNETQEIPSCVPSEWPYLNNLVSQIHVASPAEEEEAKSGSILKLLHDRPLQLDQQQGRSAFREAHNATFCHQGELEKVRCPLVQFDVDDGVEPVLDPYMPKVKFPENASGSHTRQNYIQKLGLGIASSNYKNRLLKALKRVGIVYKENQDNYSLDSVKDEFVDTASQYLPPPSSSQDTKTSKKKTHKEACSSKKPKQRLSHTKYPTKLMLCSLCCAERCQYPFSTQSLVAYVKHQAQVHSVGINCPTCWKFYGVEKKFDSQYALEKHCKSVHKISMSVSSKSFVDGSVEDAAKFHSSASKNIEGNAAESESTLIPTHELQGYSEKHYLAASKYERIAKKRKSASEVVAEK